MRKANASPRASPSTREPGAGPSHPQVVAEIDNREQMLVSDTLERLSLPFNVSLEVGNFETVKYYVAHGHGLAVVPGMCLSSQDEAIFHIIEIPEEIRDGSRHYLVVARSSGVGH